MVRFIGIMLGDGSISRNCTQAVISLHKKDDKNYNLNINEAKKFDFSNEFVYE